MYVKCLICREAITASQVIHSTDCGHLFHYCCIAKWLEQSRTCPQCRFRVYEYSTHRMYLNVEDETQPIDCTPLENQVDTQQLQIARLAENIGTVNDRYTAVLTRNTALSAKLENQEYRVCLLESTMPALKAEVTVLQREIMDRSQKYIDRKLEKSNRQLAHYKELLEQVEEHNDKLGWDVVSLTRSKEDLIDIIEDLQTNKSVSASSVRARVKKIITESPLPEDGYLREEDQRPTLQASRAGVKRSASNSKVTTAKMRNPAPALRMRLRNLNKSSSTSHSQ